MKLPSPGAALALIVGATLTSCVEKVASPATTSSEVILRIATGPAFQQSAGLFVQVRVAYARASGSQVALLDELIPVSSVNTQQLSVSVDIAPCLADPDRIAAGAGCSISVRVALLDAAKAELDSRTLGPLVVLPEQPPTTVTATLNSRYSITVRKSGTGSGSVNFTPPASSSTGGFYPANSNVTLTAAPSATSIFAGWSGSCSGTALTCTLRLDANKDVNAAFDTTYAITITTAGSGSGAVTANPTGPRYAPGATVTLTAMPSSGSVFSGWSGACSGAATTCVVTMSTNRSVTATFVPAQSFSITVTKSGTGTGSVTLDPPGPSYTSGTSVMLTAIPSSGSLFVNWSGNCTGTSSTCTLSMTANRSVNAVFNLANTTYDGDYTGSYGGAASGSVVFTVRNGVINVTQPGAGQGTVNSGGSASFSGTLAAFGCTVTFSGSFFVVGSGLSAGGTWACGPDTGTWSATGVRVP